MSTRDLKNWKDIYDAVIQTAMRGDHHEMPSRGAPVFLNIGPDRVISIGPGDHAILTSCERPWPMVMDGLSLIVLDWDPAPLRWWWRRRFTRWLLRKMKRMPPRLTPPVTLEMSLGLERVFSEVEIGARSFEFAQPLAATSNAHITATVRNHSDQTLRVSVGVYGAALR